MPLTQVQGQMLSGSNNTTTTIQSNGTTAITIDSSQNVGIGNTPSGTSATGYRSLELGTTAGTGITAGNGDFYVPVNAYVAGGAWKYATTSTASLLNINTTTLTWSNAGSGTAGNNISFSERMRITSGGTLLVGTTTETTLSSVIWKTTLSGGGNNLAVVNTSTNGSTTSGFQASNFTGGSASIINFYNGSSGFAGNITIPTNGSTGTTVSYNTSSDYRMKENIAPMTGALNKVLQLNPVTYTWKSNGYAGQGFIAHELQAVVPDCVSGEKDAVDAEGNPIYQGVDTSFLVATLTAAIQELKAELDATKAEVAELKAKGQ